MKIQIDQLIKLPRIGAAKAAKILTVASTVEELAALSIADLESKAGVSNGIARAANTWALSQMGVHSEPFKDPAPVTPPTPTVPSEVTPVENVPANQPSVVRYVQVQMRKDGRYDVLPPPQPPVVPQVLASTPRAGDDKVYVEILVDKNTKVRQAVPRSVLNA